MSNETKQTAVEWLVKQLQSNSDIRWRGTNIYELGEKAKEIEKEQIKDAYWNGSDNDKTKNEILLEAEEFYNEWYNEYSN